MTHDSSEEQRVSEHVQKKASGPPKPIASADLLQGHRERQILHGTEVYRLTLTRTGKLILHK
ncbi:MAG TPA: hemin uptake protein HemP [Planctomycetaceae bacterium]|nr:hemin uptake protein HemP [Planctomycetaceae bacterium]